MTIGSTDLTARSYSALRWSRQERIALRAPTLINIISNAAMHTPLQQWVIFVRSARSRRSRHVRFAPKADFGAAPVGPARDHRRYDFARREASRCPRHCPLRLIAVQLRRAKPAKRCVSSHHNGLDNHFFSSASRCLASLSSSSVCCAIRSAFRASSSAPENAAACSTSCRMLSRIIAMRFSSSRSESELPLLMMFPQVNA